MKISNAWLPVIVIVCFALGFWLVSALIDKLKSRPSDGSGSDGINSGASNASGGKPSEPDHPVDDRFSGPFD